MTEEKQYPVTKEDMEIYIEIQESGICNMLSREVREIIGIDKSQHKFIMRNYAELREFYKL